MRSSEAGNRDGYALIEVIAAFAVFAMIAGLCVPTLPTGRTGASIEATRLDIVALLRDARTASMIRGVVVPIAYDSRERILRGRDRSIELSVDTALSYKSGPTCGSLLVVFRPDGTSCGSILHLVRGHQRMDILVNWVDGAIDIEGPA